MEIKLEEGSGGKWAIWQIVKGEMGGLSCLKVLGRYSILNSFTIIYCTSALHLPSQEGLVSSIIFYSTPCSVHSLNPKREEAGRDELEQYLYRIIS